MIFREINDVLYLPISFFLIVMRILDWFAINLNGVVAMLLTLILRSGLNILAVAGEIWTQGKMVANNTKPTKAAKTRMRIGSKRAVIRAAVVATWRS